MNMPGLGQPQAEDKKEGFTSTPAFKIIFNATLFIVCSTFNEMV